MRGRWKHRWYLRAAPCRHSFASVSPFNTYLYTYVDADDGGCGEILARSKPPFYRKASLCGGVAGICKNSGGIRHCHVYMAIRCTGKILLLLLSMSLTKINSAFHSEIAGSIQARRAGISKRVAVRCMLT